MPRSYPLYSYNPMLFVPDVFEDCFTVQQQIAFLYRRNAQLEARVLLLEAPVIAAAAAEMAQDTASD